MKFLAVLSGIIALLCLIMGVLALLGTFPEEMADAMPEFTWDVWFWLSGLLFLASIACNAGGGRRRGGDEF